MAKQQARSSKRRLPAGGESATPGSVARAAYLAANRGHFSVANRYVAPKLLESMSAAKGQLESTKKSLHDATRLDGEARASIAATLEKCRWFVEPDFCWKAVTRNGSIVSVVVERQTITGNRATVDLTLHFQNGSVCSEKERLVRTSKGWLFGDPSDCE